LPRCRDGKEDTEVIDDRRHSCPGCAEFVDTCLIGLARSNAGIEQNVSIDVIESRRACLWKSPERKESCRTGLPRCRDGIENTEDNRQDSCPSCAEFVDTCLIGLARSSAGIDRNDSSLLAKFCCAYGPKLDERIVLEDNCRFILESRVRKESRRKGLARCKDGKEDTEFIADRQDSCPGCAEFVDTCLMGLAKSSAGIDRNDSSLFTKSCCAY